MVRVPIMVSDKISVTRGEVRYINKTERHLISIKLDFHIIIMLQISIISMASDIRNNLRVQKVCGGIQKKNHISGL